MNNRSRHMQYRRSIYRKKRIKAILLIVAASLVLLFILFMVIGTALHKKTSENKNDRPTPSGTEQSTTSPLPIAQSVGAYALPMLKDGSSFSERLSAIDSSAGAVTIDLNSTDGTLKYLSSLSSKLSFLTQATDAQSLSSVMSRIDDRELYASALLYVPSFSEENDLLRDIYLSAWCSIAVEALRAGADDCLLFPRGATVEDVDRLCELALLVRATEEEAIVGCVIPEDVLNAENSEVLIAKMAKAFNFLTLDTTSYKEDVDIAAYVESRISQMQMQLIYYKMRVLLPYSPVAEDQQKYIDTAKKYNISSWQIKP